MFGLEHVAIAGNQQRSVFVRDRQHRFEAAEALYPNDPKAQMIAYFQVLADRSGGDDYRGCNLSNAVVEYPDRQHAGRMVSQVHKQELRDRLRQQAIGVKLRHMFDEVVNEPVPDEYLEILKRADAKASGGDA